MRRIRENLNRHIFPKECQTNSCPIYRGDRFNYLVRRMEGKHSFRFTGTDDPHAAVRSQFGGSEWHIQPVEFGADNSLEGGIKFHHRGPAVEADLFVAIRYPNGSILFFPDLDEFPVPYRHHFQFEEHQSPVFVEIPLVPLRQPGSYAICAALFEKDSNPNLISNCYWSSIFTTGVQG